MTCNDCIHSEVCYLKKDGISENYADKCGYRLFENEIRPNEKIAWEQGYKAGLARGKMRVKSPCNYCIDDSDCDNCIAK